MRSSRLLLLALLPLTRAIVGQPAPAPDVREFRVDDAWGRDSIQFRTSAPVEEIVGTTNQVTGTLRADPKNIAGPGTSARFEVELASIRTGIDVRDGHVAKALGAEKNPVAVFALEKIRTASLPALEAGKPVDVAGEGWFELKGVKRKVAFTARLAWVPKGGPFSQMRPGNFVKVTSEFDVRLEDFGVSRSGPVLPLQVGEIAHVTLSALASDATPEEAEAYRQKAITYMGKARK
jgi:polyisoprenoid-binding protein YceI